MKQICNYDTRVLSVFFMCDTGGWLCMEIFFINSKVGMFIEHYIDNF